MKLGGLDISTVKLGASQVQAIYQGPNLVWQNAPVAIAATGIGATSFTANWEAYSGATYYLLDVSESSDFSTFIYQNQIVEAPNTSYVVIGLNSNTTYYYRVRASDDDVDAALFSQRVIAAGGTLSTTEQNAVNTLVVQMKADGIWTKMKAIYPMVGASAAACAQNLKSSSFTSTFNGGWTFASTHIAGNGTNAFMNTTIVPTLAENLDWSMGVYMRTNTGGGSNNGFGMAVGSTNGSVRYYIGPRWTGFSNVSNFTIGQGANEINAAGPNAAGLFHGSRTANNAISSRRNNTSLAANTISMSAVSTDKPIYVGGSNNNGSLAFPINDQINFVYFGSGLTNGEMDNLYASVQAMNTTLLRQV